MQRFGKVYFILPEYVILEKLIPNIFLNKSILSKLQLETIIEPVAMPLSDYLNTLPVVI